MNFVKALKGAENRYEPQCDVNAAQLAQIADLVKRDLIHTAVGSILTLADARAAHEMLAGARPHKRGKIVLQVVWSAADSPKR